MTKYLINELPGSMLRTRNLRVEADGYEEEGNNTVFRDAEGNEVLSLPTSKVKSIRIEE